MSSSVPRIVLCLVSALWLNAQTQVPAVLGLTPTSGSSANQIISAVFADADGATDLNVMNILVNDALVGSNACYVAYQRLSPTAGSLYLVRDANDPAQPLEYMPLPGTGTVSNSQCTISGIGSTVSESGSALTLTLNVTFKPAFGGNRVVYAAARDKGTGNSGWKTRGVFTVPPPKAMDPVVVSMTPARGESSAGSYVFRFQDLTGVGNLGVVNILVNTALDARAACYLAYSTELKLLFLVKDPGDAGDVLGPATLGTAGTLANSQCAINLANSSGVATGNFFDLTLDMTFADGFAGDRLFYMAARSRNQTRNSGWQPKGTVGFSSLGNSSSGRLLSLLPATGAPGQTFNATVSAIGTLFSAGQVQASLGSGITVNSVTVNSVSTLTLNLSVAANAALGNRSLTVSQGAASLQLANALSVQPLTPASPVISSFNPASGPPGTIVTLAGSNLSVSGLAPQVFVTGQGGGLLSAPLSTTTPTSAAFVIPPGSATGPITLSTASGTAITPSAFSVTPSSTFSLSVKPAAADLLPGQTISYAVVLEASTGFPSLARLSLAGLPAGLTASFRPEQIGIGQTAVLTIVAPAGQPAVTAVPLTVRASAPVDGLSLERDAGTTLRVRPVTTSFLGRTVISNSLQTPLAGVTVRLLGKDGNGGNTACSGTTVSDDAGNFLLTGLPVGCSGSQLVGFDGLTVTQPAGKYAGVNIVYTFVANQATASPVLVHLPRIDNEETFLVTQNAATDQSYRYSRIPGLSVTVYRGTVLTMPDGSRPNPFPLTAVEVPIDRLPDYKPPVPTMVSAFIVAFQPANAKASKPVAVYYPNSIGTAPNTSMTLMTLDPTRGRMVPYGTGIVSTDGFSIVPDLDPANPGTRYGIVDFDWHGPMPPPPGPAPAPDLCRIDGCEPPPCGPKCGNAGDPPTEGDPVDLASGIHVMGGTDIAVSGTRGTIAVQRNYQSMNTADGPFGIGTQYQYGWLVDGGNINTAASLILISPTGNRFLFGRQTDGTLKNIDTPWLMGAVMTTDNGGITKLRQRNGVVYEFTLTGRLSALTAITDPNGNVTTFNQTTIAGQFRITRITDPVGRALTLSYDGRGHVISIADPIGRTVSYGYNPAGTLLTRVTDPAGGITAYEYDAQNRVTTMTDPRGVVMFRNTYNAAGRVIQQVQANGGLVRFEYLLANPTAPSSPVIRTTVTDELGNQTSYRFNMQGYVTDVMDALGQTKRFTREQGTNLLLRVEGPAQCLVCGPAGRGEMRYTYDSLGNRLTETDALGSVTRYTYDSVFSRVSTVTNALGHILRYAYDSAGNLTSMTDERGNTTGFRYGAYGLLAEVTNGAGSKTSVRYDGFGNPVVVTDALGNVTKARFDAISRMVQVTDPLGRNSSTVFDALNRLVSVRDGRGNTSRFAYDGIGRLLSLTDPRGNTTMFSYDSQGKMRTRTSPLGKSETYQYDLRGNVIQHTDRRGHVNRYSYDALHRLVREVYQDGAIVTRAYDPSSRLANVSDSAGGEFRFTYDGHGSLIRTSGPTGTVAYVRDALHRVETRQVVGQNVVTYSYDAAGNMLSAAMPGAGITFTYDSRNLPLTALRSNGVMTRYGYEERAKLSSITHSRGPLVLDSLGYGYDSSGARNIEIGSGPQTVPSQIGTANVNAGNELLASGSFRYVYDANGNVLTASNSEGTTEYWWDSRNRLVAIRRPAGVDQFFSYDHGRSLISVLKEGGGQRAEVRYVLDSILNVAAIQSGGVVQEVLTGRSIDSHFSIKAIGSTAIFGLTNAIGSVISKTDSSGSATSTTAYSAFGEAAGDIAGPFPFGFAGRIPVSTNVLYLRNRFYDPTTGRFLSEDPMDYVSGDHNLFRYATNRPTEFTDPLGLFRSEEFLGAVLGGASTTAGAAAAGGLRDPRGIALAGAVGGVAGGVQYLIDEYAREAADAREARNGPWPDLPPLPPLPGELFPPDLGKDSPWCKLARQRGACVPGCSGGGR